MATLEKLPNLKILSLLYEAFEGKNMVCSKRGFPLLQSLFLSELFQLEEWRVEEGAMPNLCYLEIVYCPRLKTIPDGLRFVTTLQKLEIKSMQKSFKDKIDKGGPDFDKVKTCFFPCISKLWQRMIIFRETRYINEFLHLHF